MPSPNGNGRNAFRSFEPKFDECKSCQNFKSFICRSCGAGEFFEEKVRSRQPDEEELMSIFAGMDNDE